MKQMFGRQSQVGPPPTIIPGTKPLKQPLPRTVKREHITYVLSAHGASVKETFLLPKDFLVHTYVPPGKQLACALSEPNKICLDPRNAPGNYLPGTPYTNDILAADANKRKAFYSGVKDCSTNEIVFNIDRLGRTTNMEEVVNVVKMYHNLNHPGAVAHLHCLYCRDSAGGVKSRRRRLYKKKLRTRRRNTKQ